VELTGERVRVGDELYAGTVAPGVWVRESDAVIPTPRALTPWGGRVEGRAERLEDERSDGSREGPTNFVSSPGAGAASGSVAGTGAVSAGGAHEHSTWIEVSIEGGWLLAYEGARPVYATLISPGKGGAAKPGEDPLERHASPVGTYPISGKFVTSTMEAPGDLIHSDVPFAQNLIGPYAIHAAYWHDHWGYPESGGCINLSPIDAKWMFDFTEPRLPAGWHGVRWLPKQGPSTLVILHR
jgi:hypothetical protein